MSRNGHRPRRGAPGPNVLVSGDPGSVTGQGRAPQGGARDVATEGPSESGNLAAREFGTPQADLPGGVRHLVNPQTFVDSPAPYEPRPADYHKEHGVEPHDWGQYVTPPDESEHYPVERPAPLVHVPDAVPVYQVEAPHKQRWIRTATPYNVNIHDPSKEPSRICNRDPNRVELLILNEDSTTDIRIGLLADLQQDPAQGAGAGSGALIWHGTNSYTKIKTQDNLWGVTTISGTSARLSVISITEIPETAGIE